MQENLCKSQYQNVSAFPLIELENIWYIYSCEEKRKGMDKNEFYILKKIMHLNEMLVRVIITEDYVKR